MIWPAAAFDVDFADEVAAAAFGNARPANDASTAITPIAPVRIIPRRSIFTEGIFLFPIINSRYESHNIAYALSLAKKYGDVWKELDSHNPVAIAKPPNAAEAGATAAMASPRAPDESPLCPGG